MGARDPGPTRKLRAESITRPALRFKLLVDREISHLRLAHYTSK